MIWTCADAAEARVLLTGTNLSLINPQLQLLARAERRKKSKDALEDPVPEHGLSLTWAIISQSVLKRS
jgi:hypothetical protein